MSGLQRKKIALDDDPLAKMMGDPFAETEDDEPYIQPTAQPSMNAPTPAKVPMELPRPINSTTSATGAKKVNLFGDDEVVVVEKKGKSSNVFGDDADVDVVIESKQPVYAPVTAERIASGIKANTTSEPVASKRSIPSAGPAYKQPSTVEEQPPTVQEQRPTVQEQPPRVEENVSPPPAPVADTEPTKEVQEPARQVKEAKEEKPTKSRFSALLADDDGDDLFSYDSKSPKPASGKQEKSQAPKQVVKGPSTSSNLDLHKEDDADISDLNVAKILEKEEALDYNLFGRTETAEVQKKKVQKRLTDLDREDDFLRQLDELTAKASISPKHSTTATASAAAVASSAPATATMPSAPAKVDIDVASMDLSAYIAQESSGGGGLFDD